MFEAKNPLRRPEKSDFVVTFIQGGPSQVKRSFYQHNLGTPPHIQPLIPWVNRPISTRQGMGNQPLLTLRDCVNERWFPTLSSQAARLIS